MVENKKKLLFVSPRFLFPCDSGGKIRTTQILKSMKGGRFKISLLMPSSALQQQDFESDIKSVCDELITWPKRNQSTFRTKIRRVIGLCRRLPVSVQSDWSAEGARSVRVALENSPDIIVFDFPHSVILAPRTLAVPSVLFTHNVEAEIFLRHWNVSQFFMHKAIWRNQYYKMRRFEKNTLSQFDAVVAVSERDKTFFGKEYGIASCTTIPTGVDTGFFSYAEPRGQQQIVFCGSMDWMANIDGIEFFFERVWPSIVRDVPKVSMKVVGRAPPSHLVNRICNSSPEWEFTGYVTDIREHVCGADAFIIPLRVGGGTRIKAFESMAMGVPVVSTSIGVEGLPVEDQVHFLSADEPEAFANAIIALLTDAELRRRISETARQLVEEKYGFERAGSTFESICWDALTHGSQQQNATSTPI